MLTAAGIAIGTLVLVSLVVVANVYYWASKTGLPFYPSSPEEERAVIELLEICQPLTGPIYELGYG